MAIRKMKKIWENINNMLLEFRCCFSREATFQWFLVVITGMITRSDFQGVTSIIRELLIDPSKYTSLIHFYHSTAWTSEGLRDKWIEIIKNSGSIFRLDGLITLIGDGVKQAKEATRMPGVKKLHQESENSTKPGLIRGHHFGGIGVLVGGLLKQFCLPLSLTLHEGVDTILGWEDPNYEKESHVSRLVREACTIAQALNEQCLLLLDRYFLTQPALKSIMEAAAKNGGKWPVILITRPKDNYTAWYKPDAQTVANAAEAANKSRRGRKPKLDKPQKPPLGEKIKIMDLFALKAEEFTKATLTIYGESKDVSLFCINLIWGRELFQELRFVFVNWDGTKSLFVTTALDMEPARVVELYCYRFKIETFFRAFKQSMAGFGYHFWTRRMPAFNMFSTVETMEHKLRDVSAKVSKDSIISTYHAIEGFVMFACIAMGIVQLCSLRFAKEINNNEKRWTRTSNRSIPAEETTMVNLRFALPILYRKCRNLPLAKAIMSRQVSEDGEKLVDRFSSKPA